MAIASAKRQRYKTVLPAGTDLSDLKIFYGDASVAQMSKDGTITAKGAGVTEISYEIPSAGLKATVEVRVYTDDGAYGMAEYALKVGRSFKVVAGKIIGEESLDSLEYSIGNSAVARIEQDGTVTAVKPGVTKIVVKNEKTNKTEEILLKVYAELSADSGIWQLINESDEAKRPVVSEENPNTLEMTILTGDIANKLKNVMVTLAPEGDFSFTVKVTGGLDRDFQSVGLIAYANDQNVVVMERRYHSYFGGNVFCISTFTDSYVENKEPDVEPATDAYLKLEKKGNIFTAYYSFDGEDWTKVSSITSPAVAGAKDLKIGLVARSGTNSVEAPVQFTDFAVNGEIISFVPEREPCQFLLGEGPLKVNTPEDLPKTLKVYFTTGEIEELNVTFNGEGKDLSKAGSYDLLAEVEGFKATVKGEISKDSERDIVLPSKTVQELQKIRKNIKTGRALR